MTGKMRKNMGFSLMPVAFLFLFEPSYSLIDPLPDFIGYFILCFALINLADINPKLMDAFKQFRIAVLVGVLRIVAVMAINLLFEKQERSVISLLLIFVFAFSDVVILIPGYKKMFEGFLYLGTYHNGSAVYETKKEGAANASEHMYALSVLFVVVKNVFWALPEFTTLAADDTYEFINVLRLFAAVIIIPVAIVWLVRIIKYFRAINKDADFVESLKTVYLEKIQNARDFFISRVVSIGLAIMTGAFILSLDFTVDSVNAISDIWLYIAAIVSALFLRRHTEKWKLLIIPSTLGIAAAVFCDLATNHFFSRHSPNDVIRNIEAYNSYYFMLFMYVAEAVIFIGLLLCAIPAIRDLFVSYTDMSGNIGSSDYKAMKRKFNCGSATVLSLGVIAALSGLYYVYSIPRTYKGLVFELSGIISHTLCIVFVFVTWYFIGYVKSAIKQHCKSSLY